MKAFTKAFSGIKFPDSIVEELQRLPTFMHEYGSGKNYYDGAHWANIGTDQRGLAFTRNAHRDFPEYADAVIQRLSEQFPHVTFLPRGVNFIRNYRGVVRHTDELRKCSLNIGLRNSNLSKTLTDDGEYIMENGDGYLLNVLQPHAVKWIGPFLIDGPARFQITYSFIEPYEQVVQQLGLY